MLVPPTLKTAFADNLAKDPCVVSLLLLILRLISRIGLICWRPSSETPCQISQIFCIFAYSMCNVVEVFSLSFLTAEVAANILVHLQQVLSPPHQVLARSLVLIDVS